MNIESPTRLEKSAHRVKKSLLAIVIVGFFIGLFVVLQVQYRAQVSTPVDSTDSQRREVVIPEGSSAAVVGDVLEQEGLLRSRLAFKIYVSTNDLDKQFVAGRFALRRDQSMEEIISILTNPVAAEQWITILEGWRATEIADYLAREGFAEREAILTCVRTCTFEYSFLSSKPSDQGLEGYLFPDTYIVANGATPREIVATMLSTFDSKLTPELRETAAKKGRSIHDIVTMASIVEREASNDDDRPIIAGILWKRLDNNVGLGADATVLYALGDWSAPLTSAALDTDSPYNTRKFAGLPPGPIASPGIKSIEAAVNPEDSPYWYYLHTLDTGETKYAATLDEHNQNVATYLR